jgi:hypothetical protein
VCERVEVVWMPDLHLRRNWKRFAGRSDRGKSEVEARPTEDN